MIERRRRHGGLTDEELQEVAERVSFLIEQDDRTDEILETLERRIFEWIGRKAAQGILLLVGAIATWTWLLIQWLKSQGAV